MKKNKQKRGVKKTTWTRKHLLGIQELSKEEILLLMDQAESFREILERPIPKVPALRGKTIVNLFCEPSTRTRTSFELAAKRLSADTVSISTSSSSFIKGESLKDTARNIEAMQIDMIIIRHVHLNDVKVLLEQNEDRVGNWAMGDPTPSEKKTQKEDKKDTKRIVTLPVMTDLVEFENISCTLRRPGLTDKVVYIESLQWKPTLDRNIQLRSSGEVLDKPMKIESVITSMESLKKMGAVRMEMEAFLEIAGDPLDWNGIQTVYVVEDVRSVEKLLWRSERPIQEERVEELYAFLNRQWENTGHILTASWVITFAVVKGEPTVYHVISRTALDGFVMGDVEKEYLVNHIKRLSRVYFAEVLGFCLPC